ncbi:MAG: bifunctional DNA primase/polymerase, partial [Acidobacteriota bacterium]|nr:bifunctional DNA primase/polymerase [Acidobacteriota bacterium]
MPSQTDAKKLPETPLAHALFYVAHGWSVVPIPHGKKAPAFKEWHALRISEGTAPRYFNSRPQNIGVILGSPSRNLVDIDLDCDEAVELAPYFLPFTLCVFGRASKPESHYLYYSDIESAKFTTPATLAPQNAALTQAEKQNAKFAVGHRKIDGNTLLEIRSNGRQTVFPGSTHPSGECIRFDVCGSPSSGSSEHLHEAASHLAACALLAQAWKAAQGSRHDLALTVAGGLARAGWSQDKATKFITLAATAAGDNEIDDRIQAVNDTFTSAETGNVKGFRSAAEIIGHPIVSRFR